MLFLPAVINGGPSATPFAEEFVTSVLRHCAGGDLSPRNLALVQRTMDLLPRQGDKDPWRNTQNYALDKKIIRKAPLEDGALLFAELELRPIGAAPSEAKQDAA